jgi:hypothetical protein
MNLFIKLGQKIEECKKHLFNLGFDYESSDQYVRMIFEETGLRFGVFDSVEKEDLEQVIEYLHTKIITEC